MKTNHNNAPISTKKAVDEHELFFNTIRIIERWAKTPSNSAIRDKYKESVAKKCVSGDPINAILLEFLHEVSNHWFSGDVFENVNLVLLTADALNGCIDKTRIKKVQASTVGFCPSCGEYTVLQVGHIIAHSVVGNTLGAENTRCICAKCNQEEGTHTDRNSIARYISARIKTH
jgi:5-methylcytosine-specific restriction endonuclease McrA